MEVLGILVMIKFQYVRLTFIYCDEVYPFNWKKNKVYLQYTHINKKSFVEWDQAYVHVAECFAANVFNPSAIGWSGY